MSGRTTMTFHKRKQLSCAI